MLAHLALLTGCGRRPGAAAGSQMFASPKVMRELHDTRPAFVALPFDQQAILHFWLLANCGVGAEDRSTQIAKLNGPVELALRESFRMGPAKAFIEELIQSRRSDFSAIQAQLNGEDRGLFDAKLRERLAALSEDAYVQEGVNVTIRNYRLASLDGLARIGSKSTLEWLSGAEPTITDPDLKRDVERTLSSLRARLQL
jgi:hypothetical protein